MLKPNISAKSTRIEVSTIHLLNGNVVKFSYTNRKHCTVGDPMAFPIVKMGNKNPENLPSPCTMWTQYSNASPHAPPQTADPTAEALSHTYAVKSPLVTMARPKFAPKYPFPWTDLQTPLSASSLDPSDLRCQTASGSDPPFFHNALYRQTDRQIVHGKV